MPIKAILFDLDETLTLQERPFEEAYLATCLPAALKHGVEAARMVVALYEASYRICDELRSRPFLRRIRNGGRDILWGDATADSPDLRLLASEIPGFRTQVWRVALDGVGIKDDALAASMARAFPDEMRSRIAAYPDAASCLNTLSGRYKVAVVTNGLPATQRQKLRLTGLDGFFNVVSVSGDVGIAKPHPPIFHAALSALGVSASEAALVGDRLELDVAGAKAVGMHAIWLNRYGSPRDAAQPAPDHEIGTLGELPALL
jgi:putative hydrolase of the HAD superfamily